MLGEAPLFWVPSQADWVANKANKGVSITYQINNEPGTFISLSKIKFDAVQAIGTFGGVLNRYIVMQTSKDGLTFTDVTTFTVRSENKPPPYSLILRTVSSYAYLKSKAFFPL